MINTRLKKINTRERQQSYFLLKTYITMLLLEVAIISKIHKPYHSILWVICSN